MRLLFFEAAELLPAIFSRRKFMKPKIWLALSVVLLPALAAPPILATVQETGKAECQVSKLDARREHRKEITAFRRSQRDEYQKLISLRQEHRKEITAFRISKRATQ